MIRALVQPQSEPSTMPATRLATETDSSAGAEQVGLVGGRVTHLVGAGGRRSTSASTLKGRFTRNTQRQLAWTSSPPIGGPNAAAAPPTADHSPIAAPLRVGTEGRQQEAERGRQHEGAAHRLQDPGADEDVERRRDGAQGGRGGEDGEAEQEGPLAPGPVGPAASRDEDGGEHDGVGAQHPREGAQALAVVGGRDAGEGDVDDEQVERGQEHTRSAR